MNVGSDEQFVITGRRRFDPMSVARLTDFRLRPVSDVDGSLAWTPYCIEQVSQRAVLVGCLRETNLAAAPFYYQAQYQQARRVMVVDAAEFQRLGEAHTRQPTTPVMIYSTGRAGTTLVSKMFGRLASCVSLSEPDFHTSVLEIGNPAAADMLNAAGTLYFQPRQPQATHLVLKFRGMCVELAPALRAAHPNVVEFFLYRDAEAYVTSSMRAFSYFRSPLWAIRWAHWLKITRPILAKAMETNFDVMRRFFPLCSRYGTQRLSELGPVGLLTLSWLSMMDRARSLQLPSLRYENLMRDPRLALERLLSRCGLPEGDTALALAALEEDSQRGSVVARQRTSRYELSSKDKAMIHAVLAAHEVIQRPEYELDHAIA